MRKSRRVALLAAAMAAVITGCSSNTPNPGPSAPDSQVTTPTTTSTSGGSTSTTSPATTPPTSSSSAPADPRVAAAVKAYDNFIKATYVSYAHPPLKPGDPFPKGGDFRPYSFDPAQAKVLSYVLSLTLDGIEYRGTPPTPRVAVVSSQLAAQPYPTVTLTDCPTAPASWNAYYRATGKPVTDKPGQVKPPHLTTVTVIFYQKHWGVKKLTANASRTCTAP